MLSIPRCWKCLMASSGLISFSGEHLALEEISKQHINVENSVTLYFSNGNPRFSEVFSLYSPGELLEERNGCLLEHRLSASMTVLAAVEAAFRIDFELRCRTANPDPISNRLRMMRRGRMQYSISFTREILHGWEQEYPRGADTISAMREAFQFRNWLAHGRYWVPDTDKFDYGDVYALAESAFEVFPLEGLN